MTHAKYQFAVGDTLWDFTRRVSAERLTWYGDGLLTSAAGHRTQVGSNIHTDAEYARQQGLPAPIADGMLATNWISTMLVRTFGEDYLDRGELRTKYIKPTLVDAKVRVCGVVRSCVPLDDGRVRYDLEVWTEDETGVHLTDGEAHVEVDLE
jgi:3-hydroxybutyryl-CoA dehydratase